MSKGSTFNFSKLYFTIASFVGLIGMLVAFGIVLYNAIMGIVITDNEYLQGRNGGREIQQCSDPYYNIKIPAVEGEAPAQKTPEEIQECETKATERVFTQRRFQKKQTTIGGLVRGLLFWLLYYTHYPKMRATEGTETPETEPTPTPKPKRKRAAPKKAANKPATKKKAAKKSAKK